MLELVPMQVRWFRLNQPSATDVRWLATTLARTGAALGTSVTLEGSRLRLTW